MKKSNMKDAKRENSLKIDTEFRGSACCGGSKNQLDNKNKTEKKINN
ncbi:MAG: hypothetical protein ACFE9I_12060 [Candidatus Hermodarchaeota archaeon]